MRWLEHRDRLKTGLGSWGLEDWEIPYLMNLMGHEGSKTPILRIFFDDGQKNKVWPFSKRPKWV